MKFLMFPSLETSLISLFTFIIFMIFMLFKKISFNSDSNKNLPPSPQKLPVIGNLHQLASSPHRSLQALSQKHGPLMMIHIGSVPVLIASSSEAAKEILKTHDLIFCSRPKLPLWDILSYGSTNIAFSPYGKPWRHLKSLAIVQLLNNKRVQSFRHAREDEVARAIGMVGERCGSLVNLSELLASLSTDILCRVALGKAYRDSNFTNLLARYIDVLGVFQVGNYIPCLSWLDRLSGLKGRAEEVAKDFNKFLESVVEEHASKKTQSDQDQDLVDILLNIQNNVATNFTLSRDLIKVIILDMFLAGTHTTFTTSEWAICQLIRHPKVMEKLQKEVTVIAQRRSMISEVDLKKMKYLKAVIKETLRLHPAGPLLVPRETRQDVKLMGFNILDSFLGF